MQVSKEAEGESACRISQPRGTGGCGCSGWKRVLNACPRQEASRRGRRRWKAYVARRCSSPRPGCGTRACGGCAGGRPGEQHWRSAPRKPRLSRTGGPTRRDLPVPQEPQAGLPCRCPALRSPVETRVSAPGAGGPSYHACPGQAVAELGSPLRPHTGDVVVSRGRQHGARLVAASVQHHIGKAQLPGASNCRLRRRRKGSGKLPRAWSRGRPFAAPARGGHARAGQGGPRGEAGGEGERRQWGQRTAAQGLAAKGGSSDQQGGAPRRASGIREQQQQQQQQQRWQQKQQQQRAAPAASGSSGRHQQQAAAAGGTSSKRQQRAAPAASGRSGRQQERAAAPLKRQLPSSGT